MKIVVDNVIFQFQKKKPRGISRIWLNILPYLRDMLRERGHVIVLLNRKDSLPESFGLEKHDIPSYSFKHRKEDNKLLTSTCKSLKADLFMSTYQTTVSNIRSLIIVHDMIPEIQRELYTSAEAASRRESYLASSILICVSENTKKDLHNWYDVRSKQVEVSYPGVSREFRPRSSEEISSFRSKYKINFDYVVLDGDITDNLSEIFCTSFSNVAAGLGIVCYGGALKNHFFDACEKCGISVKRIHWLDQEEVPVALSGAKGLIFISSYEGFGLPVLEAMSCKIPVLCSRVASLPEIGKDFVAYFDKYNLKSVEDKLTHFLETRNSLVEKAFARSKCFSWKKMAEEIIHIIGA